MSIDLYIQVVGLDKVEAAFKRFPQEIEQDIGQAAAEAAKLVIAQEGVSNYPPATEANAPPVPWYERNKGMWVMRHGEVINLENSEEYGAAFDTQRVKMGVTIINKAKYGKYIGGEQQARHMARIGWRKVFDVAKEKQSEITEIFNLWIARLIRRLNL